MVALIISDHTMLLNKRNSPVSVGEIDGQPYMHIDTHEKIGPD